MRYLIIFCIIIFGSIEELFGQQFQSRIYLEPQFGLETTFSRLPNQTLPKYVENTYSGGGGKWDALLIYDATPRWDFVLDFSFYSQTNNHLKFNYKALTKNEHGWISYSIGNFARRISLQSNYMLKTWRIKRKDDVLLDQLVLKNKDLKYRSIFSLNLNAGLSYNYLVETGATWIENQTHELVLTDQYDATLDVKREIVGHGRNLGLVTGLSVQFFKDSERRFKFGCNYNYGFTPLWNTYWTIEQTDGVNYEVKTQSKGSSFSMYVAWPIKLYTIKNNKA